MGCGASLEKSPLDVMSLGPSKGTHFEVWNISSSLLYCMVQHTSEWPDYYCILDLRRRKSFEKNHVTGAYCFEDVLECLSDYCHEYMLIVYDSKPNSDALGAALKRLENEAVEPASIYVLSDSLSTYRKRYPFTMASFGPTQDQFPGPVEYIPKTSSNPAIFTIHRNNFSGCKTLIAYLNCSGVLNVSSKRLFVKTPGISLENVQFDESSEPYDEAISALFRLAGGPKEKRRKNVLIIDETGCDYGVLLCGWFLISRFGFDVQQVSEHLTNKSTELDTWYTDILSEWSTTRKREVSIR